MSLAQHVETSKVFIPPWVYTAGESGDAGERIAAMWTIAHYFGMHTQISRERCGGIRSSSAGAVMGAAMEMGFRASGCNYGDGSGVVNDRAEGEFGRRRLEGHDSGFLCVSASGGDVDKCCWGRHCGQVCEAERDQSVSRCRVDSKCRDKEGIKTCADGCRQSSVADERYDSVAKVEAKKDACSLDIGVVNEAKLSGAVSEKTLANREKRAKKKERKFRKQLAQANGKILSGQEDVPEWRRKVNGGEDGFSYRGAFGSCSQETRVKLAETRAQRLIAENEACVRKAQADVAGWERVQKTRRKREALQLVKTEQEYELVRSRDMDQLKRRQETRIMRDTEVNKVEVEKAFCTLAMTGNIPSVVSGNVQTVASGSISPGSSVSDAEVRRICKENADLRSQLEEMKKKDLHVNEDNSDDYSVGITVDDEGLPIGDFGDGVLGYVGRDGRFHQSENFYLW